MIVYLLKIVKNILCFSYWGLVVWGFFGYIGFFVALGFFDRRVLPLII